jgi:superfamily I DNA/RNA helicase
MAVPPFSSDDAQARVLERTDGALLLTGGAGTGKTAVLRARFARLIEGGAEPERVALVVGSRRARDDARAALLARLRTSLPGLRVLTVHGLAHALQKEREGEPPQVLSAADQFAKVRELLAAQDPSVWPAYGSLLELHGFADEVRQLLSRMQESMRAPDELARAADAAGLTGWHELARFAREYLDALDADNVVDFAGLLQRAAVAAAEGPQLFDHVLVDDYQDTTFAAEAILRGLAPPDLVVAADPAAHVFSFQGTTRVPLDRFAETFPGAERIELATPHRTTEPVVVTAWIAPHSSEEHAAVARELRRLHVEEGVPWRELAVVVRRQGAHVGNLLRALDDAQVPRTVPERGLSLGAAPATHPYVLALRWLVADAPAREELIEPMLTSDVVGLSPAAARGLIRRAKVDGKSAGEALEVIDGLDPAEADAVVAARETLAKAALFAGMSVQDAFRVLWEQLPCSARLVAAVDHGGADRRRDLDTVVTFANAVAEASEGGDAGVQAFLEALDAGEHGPGWTAWDRAGPDAVAVLTAHGAAGLEFDTVIVAGAVEGNFPSLGRPEPMFDLGALERTPSRSETVRARLEDERRLFRMVVGRARRGVVLVASDVHPDADELTQRSRFAAELGAPWHAAPESPFDQPVSTREAAALWRRQLADPTTDAWRRLAALDGLRALGVRPETWWFQRDWTDTGRPLHEEIRLSYSRLSSLENCELQHVLGDELGLGRTAGYQAWVGKLVHGLIEQCEKGELDKTKDAILTAIDQRWRDQEFPSKAVSVAYRRLVEERMFRNWWFNYGEGDSLAVEEFFEFEFDGVTIVGVIDRIGSLQSGGTRITDFKTGNPDNAPKAEESLQLGIYYLAVQRSESLEAFRPVRAVELAFIKGHWRPPHDIVVKAWQVSQRSAEDYQLAVEETLRQLIGEKKRLLAGDVYRPNPHANCFWCDFRTLCPLWPEGRQVFEAAV